MKSIPVLLLASLLFYACGSNNADQPAAEADSNEGTVIYPWQAEINDSTQRLEMKKGQTPGPDSLSIPAVIGYINQNYPKIKLDVVRSSNDTLFLKIDDAEYLTQQMGSTGPTMYFATAVYNLTEVPGIRFVHFEFEEGDHAQPDTFGRENFKDE